MPTKEAIAWLKQEFGPQISASVAGTPFSIDLIVAIACQETGGTWNALRKKGLPKDKILELCVGDTIDGNKEKGRQAFPQTKADLVAVTSGQEMFDLAHQALVEMAVHIPGYAKVAKNADKFCHGFGMFQYDLQFFKQDPNYFLQKQYVQFDKTLGKCIGELKSKQKHKTVGLGSKTSLTDEEMVIVAIAYNKGSYDPAKGLKQGYNDGKFYGEHIAEFLALSKMVQI